MNDSASLYSRLNVESTVRHSYPLDDTVLRSGFHSPSTVAAYHIFLFIYPRMVQNFDLEWRIEMIECEKSSTANNWKMRNVSS